MKKIFWLFSFAVLAAVPAVAQRVDTVFQTREVVIIDEPASAVVIGDSRERVNSGREVEVVIRNSQGQKRLKRGWSEVAFFNQIGLGYNGLVEDIEDLELPDGYEWMGLRAKSINFNLMLASGQYNFTRHFGLRMGLELEVNNYRFERDVTLTLDREGHIDPDWRFRDAGLHLEKTKLVNSFLNVPLVLNLGIGNRNQVQLYGGVVGGWRFNTYVKLKADNELLDGKKRYHDPYNLRNFHYGYTAGFAVHNIGIYATYYPHSIFKAGDADIRQVNVGLLLRY